jgi:hypothetical protein
MFYVDLFRALQEADIRYLVVGGLAMNLHGIPRMTADIDIFLSLDEANVRKFLNVAISLDLVPAVPVPPESLADPEERRRWRDEKNMIVLSFRSRSHPAVPVDVFIEEPLPFEQAWSRRKRVGTEDGKLEISVASIRDMIAMKEKAGRLQDRSDLEILRRQAGEDS